MGPTTKEEERRRREEGGGSGGDGSGRKEERKVTNVTQLSPAFIPFPCFALFGSGINKRVLRRVTP